ncbi:MAG: thioredoxin family protein [Sphingomonadales bacterium]|nr:MAG: thioredoxin family protein [Sphingomonadales bacterium]
MRRVLGGLLALCALAAPASALAQIRAPWLRTLSIEQLPRPLPLPYDSTADARKQIAAAAARARAGNKRLLIDFGGNWCPECRVLAGVMGLPEMRLWMARHYELVAIDIGRFDRNLEIPKRFGVPLSAVPALFIVDPRTARLVNRSEINIFVGGISSGRPQRLADWLAKWAAQ